MLRSSKWTCLDYLGELTIQGGQECGSCLGSASGRWFYSSVLQSCPISLLCKSEGKWGDLAPKGRSHAISSCPITGDC